MKAEATGEAYEALAALSRPPLRPPCRCCGRRREQRGRPPRWRGRAAASRTPRRCNAETRPVLDATPRDDRALDALLGLTGWDSHPIPSWSPSKWCGSGSGPGKRGVEPPSHAGGTLSARRVAAGHRLALFEGGGRDSDVGRRRPGEDGTSTSADDHDGLHLSAWVVVLARLLVRLLRIPRVATRVRATAAQAR
jgi:hypothetical protein